MHKVYAMVRLCPIVIEYLFLFVYRVVIWRLAFIFICLRGVCTSFHQSFVHPTLFSMFSCHFPNSKKSVCLFLSGFVALGQHNTLIHSKCIRLTFQCVLESLSQNSGSLEAPVICLSVSEIPKALIQREILHGLCPFDPTIKCRYEYIWTLQSSRIICPLNSSDTIGIELVSRH